MREKKQEKRGKRSVFYEYLKTAFIFEILSKNFLQNFQRFWFFETVEVNGVVIE